MKTWPKALQPISEPRLVTKIRISFINWKLKWPATGKGSRQYLPEKILYLTLICRECCSGSQKGEPSVSKRRQSTNKSWKYTHQRASRWIEFHQQTTKNNNLQSCQNGLCRHFPTRVTGQTSRPKWQRSCRVSKSIEFLMKYMVTNKLFAEAKAACERHGKKGAQENA